MKILVVEDEIAIREKIVEYLKFDYDFVYEASNETEAFKIYREKKPDLLILDINLNESDGLDFLSRVRLKDHQTKAIIISAYSDKEYLMRAIDLKLSAYITKPITRKGFKQALQKVQNEMKLYTVCNNDFIDLGEGYIWDLQKNNLLYNSEIVSLGSKEYMLLKLFCNNPFQEFSYEDISYHIWDYTLNDKINSIKILIKKLRKKIPQDAIVNIYGYGYKLNIK